MSETKDSVQDYVVTLRIDYCIGDYWTHYKGGVYQIVAVAVKEDSLEPVIVYQSLKHGTIWVRTIKNWCEDVNTPGGMKPRFNKGAP